jgi:hypothetical protein
VVIQRRLKTSPQNSHVGPALPTAPHAEQCMIDDSVARGRMAPFGLRGLTGNDCGLQPPTLS